MTNSTPPPKSPAVRLASLVAAFAIAASPSALAAPAVTPPEVVTHVDAEYPASALAAARHADVVLAVTVDVSGHVAAIDVLQSGGADLDEAATAAARQWTFRPAMRDGAPVAARIRVPFHFAPPSVAPEVVAPTADAAPTVGGVASGAGGTASAPLDAREASTEAPARAAAAPHPSPPARDVHEDEAHRHDASTGEVVVVGRAQSPNRGASDFQLHVGELARVPRQNATELLKLAPGILLTNEGGEGHAEQVFLRGFDAREGQDLEISVGGVPINEAGNLHGNGYADTHFVIPELVHGLRVVEGPFDPRQGNFAVAGSASYDLGTDRRGLTAKYTTGSFGTERMLLVFAPRGESARTFAGAEVGKTDGFGQGRDAQRGAAIAQYEGRLGAEGSWRLLAQAYSTHYHSAGLLREDDYRAGRVGFFDSYDRTSFAGERVTQGGDSSRFSISADLETRTDDTTLTQQVFVVKRDMRLLENFTGFLLDVQEPLQSLHAQRGDMLDLSVHELTLGARGSARWHADVSALRQELELGYFARFDDVAGTQRRLEAATGVPYATESDLASHLGDLGLYADASVKPARWLVLRGGGRADLFTYDVLDRCAAQSVAHPSTSDPPIDQSCLSQQDYGRPREPEQRSTTSSLALLPRATLVAGPFAGVSLTASYGRGVRSVDPSYVTQDVKTPFASIAAYEAGAMYAGELADVALVARSIVFRTHVDKDLIFAEAAGRNVLGAGTTRTGWVGAVRLTGRYFDQSANLTLVRATYDDTSLAVAYVPTTVFRSDTAVFADLPLTLGGSRPRATLGAGVTYVGPRALPFGQTSQSLATLDASASVSWTRFELGVSSTNLLDRRYRLGEYNFASDFHSQPQPTLVPSRMFSAGAPRAFFATFAITFGGTS